MKRPSRVEGSVPREPRETCQSSLANFLSLSLSLSLLYFSPSYFRFSLSRAPAETEGMAFLRNISRRCCVGKKLTKCGASPLPAVSLLENATAATMTTTVTVAAATRAPSLRLVTQVRADAHGYATSATATTDVKRRQQQQQPPPPSAQPRQIDPLDLKFNDPIAAFKSKTTTELVRAYVVYQMCSIEYIVENNMKVRIISRIDLALTL